MQLSDGILYEGHGTLQHWAGATRPAVLPKRTYPPVEQSVCEKYLCAGEILFIPRGSDYHGVALSGLAFLYTHKRIEPSRKELNTTIGMHRFSSMNPVG